MILHSRSKQIKTPLYFPLKQMYNKDLKNKPELSLLNP